jgi:hypothetical protein
MNRYQRWFGITLVVALVPLLLVGGFNYYIDPLWNFSHANPYNMIQISFDERQQKTNRLSWGENDYDTLILGSSRTTYMNQNDLVGHRTYNYALSIMLLEEYYDYLQYAKLKNGHDFAYIVIGLDFFVSNKNIKMQNDFHPPSYYIGKSNEFAYRYKTLLSLDVLDYSLKNYEASRIGIPQTFDYDRHNIKTLNKVPEAVRDEQVNANLAKYKTDIYANYEYRDVKQILSRLKADNPHSTFIVFTTPTARPLWDLMAAQGLMPYYEQWLKDSVEVFGQVYNFDYPNSITNDLDNYYDASHVYPEIETLIAHKIINYPDNKIPADFGTLLTKDNILRNLEEIKTTNNQ